EDHALHHTDVVIAGPEIREQSDGSLGHDNRFERDAPNRRPDGQAGLRNRVSRALLLSNTDSDTTRPSNIRLTSRWTRTRRLTVVAGTWRSVILSMASM